MIIDSLLLDGPGAPAIGVMVLMLPLGFVAAMMWTGGNDSRGRVAKRIEVFGKTTTLLCLLTFVLTIVLMATERVDDDYTDNYRADFYDTVEELGWERAELMHPQGSSEDDGDEPVLVGVYKGEYMRCAMSEHAPGKIKLDCEGA